MMRKGHYIRLHNAVFYGYHGNMHEERNLGGRFHVDVELKTDFSRASETDDLHNTVNYETVYTLIQDIMTSEKHRLLETIAERIASVILETWPVVESVVVKVRKPGVPLKGVIDYVEVEIDEQR